MAMIAGSHHKRLADTGYPLGLDEDCISMETRIVPVADVFDALTPTKDRDIIPKFRKGHPNACPDLDLALCGTCPARPAVAALALPRKPGSGRCWSTG